MPPFGQCGKQRVSVFHLRREDHPRCPVQREEVDFRHDSGNRTVIFSWFPAFVPAMIETEDHVESSGRRLPDQRPSDDPGYPRQRPLRHFMRIAPGDAGVAHLRVPVHERRHRNRCGTRLRSLRIEPHPSSLEALATSASAAGVHGRARAVSQGWLAIAWLSSPLAVAAAPPLRITGRGRESCRTRGRSS